MAKIAIELGVKQIADAVRQLGPRERVLLAHKLKLMPAWAEEFDSIVKQIRKEAQKNKVTDEKIIRMVAAARHKVYGH